jgi:hypothetical protein
MEDIFGMDLSPFQDTFRFRARQLGLRVANQLIEGKSLDIPREEPLISEHIDACIEQLDWRWIQKFSAPVCHKGAEELIRQTLFPETFQTLTSVHVRKAVLAAWLTPLRQATGSCFATAPAILIQRHNPEQFFKDLYELLTTGQLKRIFKGQEFSVALSLSSPSGDLQRVMGDLEHSAGFKYALKQVGVERVQLKGAMSVEEGIRKALLKEMGLSEEEVKSEELLAKMQLVPQTAAYYQRPTERAIRVAEWKKRVEKAEIAFLTLTECPLLRSWEYTIASLSDVKTEFARWNLFLGLGLHPDMKGGVGAFVYHYLNNQFQKCQAEWEELKKREEADWVNRKLNALEVEMKELNQFFPQMMREMDEKLPEAFQEVFDPALRGVESHLYEDSPAGFRLAFKHGRRDASQWTLIYSREQYVEALREFFTSFEREIHSPLGPRFLSELITALILHLQSDSFIFSAMKRVQEAGRRSPWDYISGGTLQTLLQVYWQRELPFTEKRIVPHSAKEMAEFLLEERGKGPFLIHSPTHAFIFYPELQPLLFADTNWSNWFFGWVGNPSSQELELWRLNRTGTEGFPMQDWKEWLSESNTSPWILLTNPKEYGL